MATVEPVTYGQTHEERHNALLARHGPCSQVDGGMALRLAGLREEIHPLDAIAFLHQSREAAEAYAESNREHYGHPTLAIIPCDAGVIGLIDLRPAVQRAGARLTSPDLPDQPPPGYKVSGPLP